MGILDGLLGGSGQLGGLAELITRNPQVVSAALSLLSTRDTSIGGSGGLAGLVQAFQGKGLGDTISSWIATGPNPPISAGQLAGVLGDQTLSQFASKAGVATGDASSALAGVLPALIDHLTPQGSLPDANGLEATIGNLLKGLGR